MSMTATRHILCLNSGSSSIKFAIFALGAGGEEKLAEGAAERIGQRAGRVWLRQGETTPAIDRQLALPRQQEALKAVFAALAELHCPPPEGVGHRIVSGGPHHQTHRLIDDGLLRDLRAALRFAPLHLPAEIAAIEAVQTAWPHIPQIACFDTAFHQTIPEIASRLPLPRNLWHEGVRKYGFHGLSYEYIVSQFPAHADGKTIIAHLGNGASMAAVRNGQCRDTTMGLTPTGGLVMGTRSGDLDPGAMLELAARYDHEALRDLVYHRMGLLALSGGESSEMRALLESPTPAARFAVDYFCAGVRAAIGAFAAKAGGIDALVFSGGIGEHAPQVLSAVCEPLGFLGFRLDAAANLAGQTRLHASGAKPVLRIAADEEAVIRDLVGAVTGRAPQAAGHGQ